MSHSSLHGRSALALTTMGCSNPLSDDVKRRLELAGFILPIAMDSPLPSTSQAAHHAMDTTPYRGNCRRGRTRSRCASGESRPTTSLPATAGSFASSNTPLTTLGDLQAIPDDPRSTGSSGASFDVPHVSAKVFSPSAFFKSKLHRASPRSPPQSPPPSCPRVIFIDCPSMSSSS